ncbi:SdiA-regulated domain-containing protein (plasmid) [Pseudomonas sp. JZ134]
MAGAAILLLIAIPIVIAIQHRFFEQGWFRYQQRLDLGQDSGTLWLPDYHTVIDALSIPNETNMSGLTFDSSRRILVSLTNKDSRLIEMTLDGKVLRSLPMKGFGDPEAIEYIRPGVYIIVEEGIYRLTEIHLDNDTQVVGRLDPLNTRQLTLSDADTNNKGFEGLAYDRREKRLFIAKEKFPAQIISVDGFYNLRSSEKFNLTVHTDMARDRNLPVTDLSSLYYDYSTGHLLALSDESEMIIELNAKGEPVSSFTLRSGNQGLSSTVPQAEGLTMDDEANLYVISEPNLLYKFSKKN